MKKYKNTHISLYCIHKNAEGECINVNGPKVRYFDEFDLEIINKKGKLLSRICMRNGELIIQHEEYFKKVKESGFIAI